MIISPLQSATKLDKREQFLCAFTKYSFLSDFVLLGIYFPAACFV